MNNQELVEITCYNCDGDGWWIGGDYYGPEQIHCDVCGGKGKMMVTEEFAKGLEGESDE